MGVIPGNENFADVKRGYGQARSKEVGPFTVAAWSGSGAYPISDFYYAGNARMLWILADSTGSSYEKNNISVVMKNAAGLVRNIIMAGGADTSASQVGGTFAQAFSICGSIIPHQLAVENVSTRGSITITLEFNY